MFDLPDIEINVNMCCGTSDNRDASSSSRDDNKDSNSITAKVAQQSQITDSPVSIANADLLDIHYANVGDTGTVPPPPHHPASHAHSYSEGKVSVTRSARKRRIKRGCLASGGSEEYKSYEISYRIYRPELLRSTSELPLLVLHGGPSLPSSYLYPLIDQVRDRSIIFYDQLGCGQSDGPKDLNLYSISNSVDDLEALIKALDIPRFHLYGHSFGGVVAYEYIKRIAERPQYEQNSSNENNKGHVCQSIIISNSSTSVAMSNEESDCILQELEEGLATQDASIVNDAFWKRSQCRLEQTPTVLQEAIDNTGVEWFHSPHLLDYVAKSTSRWARELPPALIIGGTHDFVTKPCTEGWRQLFKHNKITEVDIDGSHYLHIEKPQEYGELLSTYLLRQEQE